MKTLSYPIFIVDDNEVYLETIEKYLKLHLKINVEIRCFTNGEDCLRNLDQNPRIIILDYLLNTVNRSAANGMEILRKIKLADPTIEVIVLSAQDNIRVATDIMKFGAFDYVSKNENAFMRIQHAIYNINRMINQAKELKMNQQSKRILIGSIVSLIAILVILQVFFPQLMNRGF